MKLHSIKWNIPYLSEARSQGWPRYPTSGGIPEIISRCIGGILLATQGGSKLVGFILQFLSKFPKNTRFSLKTHIFSGKIPEN